MTRRCVCSKLHHQRIFTPRTAGLDVLPLFKIASVDASIGRRARLRWSHRRGPLPARQRSRNRARRLAEWGARRPTDCRHVPVDGFWSISVHIAKGYFQPNPQNAYSLNAITAKPGEDGSFAIQFSGRAPSCRAACGSGKVQAPFRISGFGRRPSAPMAESW